VRPLVVIGECMAELSPTGEGDHRLGYAGDTFNAAWASRLLLPSEQPVRYVTAIGTDWISDEMFAFMAASGLDLSSVGRDPGRSIGLYAVKLVNGERIFSYWRKGSAATALADDPDRLGTATRDAAMILFSGITLAILPPAGRSNLLLALEGARAAGATIAFDPNYRQRLWSNPAEARETFASFMPVVDCALPSFADEADLFGDASVAETAARFRGLGAREVVVKDGLAAAFCVLDGLATAVPCCPVERPVDTTGAGDAFNGAFLAARLRGLPTPEAARIGHSVAAVAVQTRGALLPQDITERIEWSAWGTR
jgi:2-dehydro-3-deoxygluconokinase